MHKDNPYAIKQPDFAALGRTSANLQPFLIFPRGPHYATIDFQNAKALRALTETLLKHDFKLDVKLPEDRLCPALANRLDYLLHLLALCTVVDSAISSEGRHLRLLDIGTGAVAIYPILLARLRPEAKIVATEIDQASYGHARRTVRENGIDQVDVRRADKAGRILEPLFEDDSNSEPYTFTLCNPPFFSSAEEMSAGAALKEEGAPAAPTAASNELITPGGEVAFVGQMMDESAELQERCAWYTSLLGKASSIAPLISRLKAGKLDNYFLLSIRQAQTTRWIIGWSFTAVRLPDALTRDASSRSIARHLPPPNSFFWQRDEGKSAADLQEALEGILTSELHLSIGDPAKVTDTQTPVLARVADAFFFRPTEAIWTRAYRRAAARSQLPTMSPGPLKQTDILFEARIRVADEDGKAVLRLDWTYGRDRQPVEGFWTFLTGKLALCKGAAIDEQQDRPSKRAKSGNDA